MSAKHAATIVESGMEIFIPLNKLRKSPKNARKTPHSEAAIEAYAASIAAKGILQNLVVEPELDGDGAATGFYSVTVGEGRRLAQLLRVKRKEIKKTEPIRCIVDTANDPHEISLDDYVAAGIMRAGQAETLRAAVADRCNILVAGGTSTGKTTLTNALLAEVAKTTDRVAAPIIVSDQKWTVAEPSAAPRAAPK
jgi:ParB family transcriptional regulator, chromosome partitioning protein